MRSWSTHFRLAHELGKTLNELMGWSGPMTGRQFEAWVEWFKRKDDEPTADQWYMMQLTAEVHMLNYIMSNSRPTMPISKFRIKFEEARKKAEAQGKVLTTEELRAQVDLEIAQWKVLLEKKPRKNVSLRKGSPNQRDQTQRNVKPGRTSQTPKGAARITSTRSRKCDG